MPESLTLINCTLLPEPYSDLLYNRYILVENGHIKKIGEMEHPPVMHGTRVIDARGKLVMPGLVNGHNHCGMTLFRGMADDLSLNSWLFDHIFPAEMNHLDPDTVYWCTKLAAAEMIMSGTTTVADCYLYSNRGAGAIFESGMRGVIAQGVIDFPTPSVPDPAKNIEATEIFIKQWLDYSPRIVPAVFAHAPYSCSTTTLTHAKALAEKYRLRFFTHLAETKTEQENIKDPQGPTPITHLDGLDILDGNTVCVHAVWLDDRDIEILAASGARVISCPQSNLKLASGFAPVQKMLDHRITVGLGTDGCASNNSLDMFREMDTLAKVQKMFTGSATAMSARDVLRCATIHGAEALGLEKCGKVAMGYRADLIIVDTAAAHLSPFYNQDILVYAASGGDIETVIVDGSIIMLNKEILTFDLEEVMYHVKKRKIV